MPEYINVAVHLTRMAAEQPDRTAIYFPVKKKKDDTTAFSSLTFRELEDKSNCIASGLLTEGIKPGTRAVLMVKPSPEFFALTFALLKTGIIPVMIDPGMGASNLKDCINESQPLTFIGIPKAQMARKLLRWGKKTIKNIITVFPRHYTWGKSLDQIIAIGSDNPLTIPMEKVFDEQFKSDDTAAINFTSGSTGLPKGAVYTHGVFSAQVNLIRNTYGIQPGETDLCTFPLFALFAPALGMTAIIPDMDFTRPAQVNPEHIAEIVDKFKPTNMFGSPALLNTVGRWCHKSAVSLNSLKRIICAGAPINPEILRYITGALPENVEVFSGYGATEAMPLTSIGSKTILSETCHMTDAGKGVCVGRANEGISITIIEISDVPVESWSDSLQLKQGETGEIVAHGPVVTQSYFNRETATKTAKIYDPDSGRFRHRMGDLGWIDKQDRLWFCGRKNHRIQTSDGLMFTIPVEGVFNTHPKIYRTALIGLGQPGNQKPLLCIELEAEAHTDNHPDYQNKILSELRVLADSHEHTRRIDHFIFHKSFPVDIRHNSKIFREKLCNWAEKNKSQIIVKGVQ